ncbi:hypothetical protein R3P38DRAFT_3380927 [Favolaschia claudopus]|uniref:Uncharacterized protein n=1 Tax=Favolaschia claudopus TaxID=2862362 RepID=A0AAV9Z0K0_9AGAR
MPATTSRLRSLLLKTPSMTQPEPFLLSRTMEREGNLGELSGVSGAPVEIRANPVSRKSRNQSESERRSAGQRRRRKREAKKQENDGRLSGIGRPVNLTRSLAQRARRQRELAGDIEDLLDTKGYKDPTQSLDQALHHEYDVNQPRRNDRYREVTEVGCFGMRMSHLRWSELAHGAARSRPKVGDDRHWHLIFVGQKSGIPWRSMGSLLVYITIEAPGPCQTNQPTQFVFPSFTPPMSSPCNACILPKFHYHHALDWTPFTPLLPKTPSMTRPEPFLLKTTRNLESDANVNRDSAQPHLALLLSVPAVNVNSPPKLRNLLDIKEHDSQQSRAQKLRRKVEQGERKLRAFPDCDHGRALDEALDHEWMLNQPRREDRHRESQRKISLQSRVDSGQTSIKWFRERPKAPLTSSVRSQTTYDNFVAASPVDRTPLHTQ